MKILGISAGHVPEEKSLVCRTVRSVLSSCNCPCQLISLRNKDISWCRACNECSKDMICKQEDQMAFLRKDIVEANALIMGAACKGSTMDAAAYVFLERWIQFREHDKSLLKGKLGVVIGFKKDEGQNPAEEIDRIFRNYHIETIAKLSFTMDDDNFEWEPNIKKNPEWLNEAAAAGIKLKKALSAIA